MQTISPMQPIKKKRTNKLVLGFAALVASAIVGTTGFAAATNGTGNGDKPSKEQCAAAAGFKNYGQCVKEWAKNKNRPGGGYGGNVTTNVTADVDLEVNGNNNVITVIINIFR